ncbi:aldo/keto reductase [Qipengyuania sp. DGS5-3]|uniref:aldo/keto reductase n=1 Tax=Qipengyuania sp. DGS5-3 TaxID=3349632 RepID=UPI0036D28F3E
MAAEQLNPIRIAENQAIKLAGARRIGLGCMALTGIYGAISRKQAIATLHAALDQDVTLFDTAPLYGNGENELLLGHVLGGHHDATIVTKFGLYADSAGKLYHDSRPKTVRLSVEASLRRLKRDRIDVLIQHRVDPDTAIDEVQECIVDLIAAGKVGEFGISNVSAGEISRLPMGVPLSVVQNELSLVTGAKDAECEAATARSAAFMAYSPLGRGILTGSKPFRADDFRTSMTAFAQPPAATDPWDDESNLQMAAGEGYSLGQALDWVLAQGENVVAIPGCRSPSHVLEVFSRRE